jgi:glycosyltransferase involved in cell wall biosynthesis
MQVHFLTQSGAQLPSVRFRVLPYVGLGLEAGLRIAWGRIPKSIFARTVAFARLPPSEAIVVQKKLLPPLYLKLLRRRCRRLYYDVDDAVWTHHPGAAGRPGATARREKDRQRFAATCREVDGVIAGNRFLAAKAAPHQSRVTVLPTPIDTDTYRPREGKGPGHTALQVGWMGTAANQHFLPPALRSLQALSAAIEVRVISNENRLGDMGAGVHFEPWSAEAEITQLQGFDIGLMPLTDDEYTRGKCGFKLLQYMACGVVPVASAVGFNAELIDHGKEGFLVSKEGDWGRFVARLEGDPELRRTMAARAREKVVARFDLRPSAGRLWRALGVQAAAIRDR